MKKKLFCLRIFPVLIILLFIYSCNKEKEYEIQKTEVNLSNSISIEFERLTPYSVTIKDQTAIIDFVESAQRFSLDLSKKDNEQMIDLINHSMMMENPIKVSINKNSTEILKAEELSEAEISSYKTLFVKQDNSGISNKILGINAASIIPNEATLISLFNIIKNRTCNSSTATPPADPCITFWYVVDGCYARAHKMRQLLIANGYDCQKQFVYGNLTVSTGSCCVAWGYHVAPLVQFRNSSGKIEERIIDPSLFPSGPVTPSTWRNGCINTSCDRTASIIGYVTTPGDVYLRHPTAGTARYDNSYVSTNCILTAYRNYFGCNPSLPPSTSCF